MAFSPEYLAELENGARLLADCRRRFGSLEQLLEKEPTPDPVKVIEHLGLCAASLEACYGSGFVMPHDADEQRERFLTLVQRAGGGDV